MCVPQEGQGLSVAPLHYSILKYWEGGEKLGGKGKREGGEEGEKKGWLWKKSIVMMDPVSSILFLKINGSNI